ncbi:hypothetical protein F4818DRAFT_276304 [Hypoxylon cercidicola]|nr:hypothetical protein F4818DRAFT_276304 [Hypoxylon cercidicola]
MDPFKPLPPHRQPCVGFRVECHLNRTLYLGDMNPRGWPLINGSLRETLDAFLSWKHESTPLIAFFTSWEKALRRRNWLINKRDGADVVIIAVWLKGKPEMYDAHAVASALDYPEDRLEFHKEEVILYGGIKAYENRILACLPGNSSSVEEIKLSPFPLIPKLRLRTRIPVDSLPNVWDSDRTEELKFEMHRLRGFPDEMKFCALVLSMCGQDWKLEDDGYRITFNIPRPTWGPLINFEYWFNPYVVDKKDITRRIT